MPHFEEINLEWKNSSEKVYQHCVNIWTEMISWFAQRDEAIGYGEIFNKQLTTLPHYEDFIRNNSVDADFILAHSDPKIVADFNALVDEFNDRRDEIISLGRQEADKYFERAMQIIAKK